MAGPTRTSAGRASNRSSLAKCSQVVDEHVFPFLRTLGGEGSAFSQHMKDARLGIPTPALLAKAVEKLDAVQMEDRDTKGDVYEYMLGKIATPGRTASSAHRATSSR